MTTSYFSLPREIRQQILCECFALADQDDSDAFIEFCKRLFTSSYAKINIYHNLQHQKSRNIKDPSWHLCKPFCFAPSTDILVSNLSRVAPAMRNDMGFVINKWADSKKGPNIDLAMTAVTKHKCDPLLVKFAIGLALNAMADDVLGTLQTQAPGVYDAMGSSHRNLNIGNIAMWLMSGRIARLTSIPPLLPLQSSAGLMRWP